MQNRTLSTAWLPVDNALRVNNKSGLEAVKARETKTEGEREGKREKGSTRARDMKTSLDYSCHNPKLRSTGRADMNRPNLSTSKQLCCLCDVLWLVLDPQWQADVYLNTEKDSYENLNSVYVCTSVWSATWHFPKSNIFFLVSIYTSLVVKVKARLNFLTWHYLLKDLSFSRPFDRVLKRFTIMQSSF